MNKEKILTKLGKKVIYQIYPKSFYDSDGDGIGDIRGIIEKIDYLISLHIDMIWFNPFFISPQNDNGYDIADYYNIDPLFGTMADFEELVSKLRVNHIGVMLDMVFNHCSTSHPWFQKALAGNEKYQKYFYIRPAKKDSTLPTNWKSKFGGPAWAKFGNTDKFYLHLYDPTQADLDWHNPDVRKEAANIINFWRKKGVTGFRFDVFNVIGKSEILTDSNGDENDEKKLYTDTPVVHKYLHELNRASFGQDSEVITVGEMSSTTIANSIEYTNPNNQELSMVFTFHHLKVDYKNGDKWQTIPPDFSKLKNLLFTWQEQLDEGNGWNALFWNNHDQPRALSRFCNTRKYRTQGAQMLATAIQLLRGTPFIYQGEEIGMLDPDYSSIDEYVDIESKNAYHILQKKGFSAHDAFLAVKKKSRDNSRTPMQWTDDKYAGFSTQKPWLTSTNQDTINVAAELKHGEIFKFYQKLITLRKNEPLISDGHIKALLREDKHVFAYSRYLDDSELIVLTNFYDEPASLELPSQYLQCPGTVLLSNYQRTLKELPSSITLKPYEALVFKFN